MVNLSYHKLPPIACIYSRTITPQPSVAVKLSTTAVKGPLHLFTHLLALKLVLPLNLWSPSLFQLKYIKIVFTLSDAVATKLDFVQLFKGSEYSKAVFITLDSLLATK